MKISWKKFVFLLLPGMALVQALLAQAAAFLLSPPRQNLWAILRRLL